MTLAQVELWHQRACPAPTSRDFDVQMGCHFEEIAEMVRSLRFKAPNGWLDGVDTSLEEILTRTADALKQGSMSVEVLDRTEFVDSIADQIVTSVGAGYRAGFDVPAATVEVNRSNWSKFDDNGNPIFNVHGKVAKGPNYREPNLAGCDLAGGVQTGAGAASPA